MARLRVLLGTIVADGANHGPGAPVEVPDDEAEELVRLGIAAHDAADPPRPARGKRQAAAAEMPADAGDEAGDPTAH